MAWAAPAAADDRNGAEHFHDPTDVWAIARGGQLYDNWMSVLEADRPKTTHPANPGGLKREGVGPIAAAAVHATLRKTTSERGRKSSCPTRHRHGNWRPGVT